MVVFADAETVHRGCPARLGRHHVGQRVGLVAHFVDVEVAGTRNVSRQKVLSIVAHSPKVI